MALNQELSDLFQSLASLMELKGESVFKVIAFQKVSRILRELTIDLKKCVEENTICEIEGIGKSSQQIIEEYIETGKSTVFQEIAASVPPGLIPLLQIDGLGPKTINLLWKERKITSLEELKKAITSGTLKTVKGIGDKKIQAIKDGIAAYEARAAGGATAESRRVGIVDALVAAEQLIAQVRQIPGIQRAEIAGSLSRRRETIADIDLVASANKDADLDAIAKSFTNLQGVIQAINVGPSKTSVAIANGMRVDLRVVPEQCFGAALMYFTGSKDHNVKVRGLAQKKKWTLNEWGLYPLAEYDKAKKEVAKPPPIKALACASEEEIYAKLGMQYVEPELREDRGEFEAALENNLPTLITRADIRGDLHTHTTASDGTESIEAMAIAARERGYEFLAITDHSKALAMANGLSPERLIKHIEQIHKISDKLKGITLLAGSEVDILADGRMDYEDALLKELDIVIASPHLALKQEDAKANDRLKRAIDNRYVNFVGHPTGRLINRREGLHLDFAPLFEMASKNGTAFEINSSYPRLDLNDLNARHAINSGCLLSINTDAHSIPELDLIPYGIDVARRAWVGKHQVINCMSLKDLRKFLARKR